MGVLILTLFLNAYTSELTENALSHQTNAYLAEPIHIYTVESKTTVVDSVLSESNLDDLLIKVEQASKSVHEVYYVFQINEVIAGDPKRFTTLKFSQKESPPGECKLDDDFDQHKSLFFWQLKDGRSQLSTSPPEQYHITCFEIGKEYLLLNKNLFRQKAYELINTKEDKWYQFIKSKFNEQSQSR